MYAYNRRDAGWTVTLRRAAAVPHYDDRTSCLMFRARAQDVIKWKGSEAQACTSAMAAVRRGHSRVSFA